MKQIFRLASFFVLACALQPGLARAQSIAFPVANQQVRGAIKVTFENFPDGGFAMIYLDGTDLKNLKQATSQPFYALNTLEMSEGQHSLTAIFFNAGNKRAATSTVNFTVANTVIDESAEGVKLRLWTNADIINDRLRRYRVSAESIGKIEGGPKKDEKEAESPIQPYIPAPLDYQVSMLIRTDVRDVALTDGAANIRSVVQLGYQRQRSTEENILPGPPTKAPWGSWGASSDAGKFLVKTVTASGVEKNATNKVTTLPIADLLPRFPQGTVRPGSTWESEMSFLGTIPSGSAINVRAPMTFVSFENIQTPTGVEKRCAKLEARFALPLEVATRIGKEIQQAVAAAPAAKAGDAAAAPAAGAAPAGAAGAAAEFATVTATVTREIWFDITGSQLLRATDTISAYYEEAAVLLAANATEEVEPYKVTYDVRITKYLDDRIPEPTPSYKAGAGTAHGRDNVRDPSLDKMKGK